MTTQGEGSLIDLPRLLPVALRRLRLDAGLRQTQISMASGLTKAMLSAYERGKATPSLASLCLYLAALGRDLADLQEVLSDLAGLPKRRSEDVEGRERTVGRAVLRALRGLELTEGDGAVNQDAGVNPGEPSTRRQQQQKAERRPNVVFVLLTDSAGLRPETLTRAEELVTNCCLSTNPTGR